ncbi:MAG TPA: hypothetical protein PKA84_01355 [Rubrivivax sp.]|nr:hypothetical protein [Rubrivivax sp.]HMR68856.1 hypothetical protein [Rubrivivax sp.]
MSDAATILRGRIDRWEVAHLRAHAQQIEARYADAHDLISVLRAQLAAETDRADYWHRQVELMRDQLEGDRLRIAFDAGRAPDAMRLAEQPAPTPPETKP